MLYREQLRNANRISGGLMWCVVLVCSLVLTACKTPLTQTTLTDKQQQVLREQGFTQNEHGWELQMSGKLLFEFDSAILGDPARKKVSQLAQALMKEGIDHLRIEGYTDDRGTDAYNMKLSMRRAEAVSSVLINTGMAKQHIEIKGFGNSLPIDPEKPSENRRVAIIVPLN